MGCWGGNASFPVPPAAKLSEAEEEQEDPYLNDRCRGETVPLGRGAGSEAESVLSA